MVALASIASPIGAQATGGAASRTAADEGAPVASLLGGPVVAGVCPLSREAVYTNAAIGRAASARLQELTRTAQGEIDSQRAPLEGEAHTLESQRGTLRADQIRQRQEALSQGLQALQRRAAHSSREIEATRERVLQRIADEAQPVVANVYQQKGCGLLLDRSAALDGNFANDEGSER
ncbi:OmpH family outer membrane protein [Sphingosinicella sp. LHD-64]|uniref:OmpH family outer membrane protein n=1 Tax=Sphingosinicella sp. LHD-64 TaxID=3072139 RepID=UPI00280E1924|nr:OmpH family outer membrane protein [Sphingosinicella sp. LHD-64]MDQ8757558.1 OmpH family outer membrane protein [Sphingosinicella sp. LHD-64]